MSSSSDVTVEASHRSFAEFLDVVRNATNNDFEIAKKLQHTFNKASSAYRVSAEFKVLLQSVKREIEENEKNVHKSLIKLVNELKAYSNKINVTVNTFVPNTSLQTNAQINDNNCKTGAQTSGKRTLDEGKQEGKKRLCLAHVTQRKESEIHKGALETEVSNDSPVLSSFKEVTFPSHLFEVPAANSEAIVAFAKQSDTKKRNKQIHRLENLLAKIDKQIKKLQARELSLSEMEDEESTYVMEDRYKKKFVKVWEALCKLKDRNTNTGRCIEEKISYAGSSFSEVNKKVEKLLNKAKVFPDYQDICELVQRCDEQYGYKLGKSAVSEIARDIFVDVGKILQKRRQKDFLADFGCYLVDNTIDKQSDPAETDPCLVQKLASNQLIGQKKLEEIIEKFVNKQDRGEDCDEVEEQNETDDDADHETAAESIESDEDIKGKKPIENHNDKELHLQTTLESDVKKQSCDDLVSSTETVIVIDSQEIIDAPVNDKKLSLHLGNTNSDVKGAVINSNIFKSVLSINRSDSCDASHRGDSILDISNKNDSTYDIHIRSGSTCNIGSRNNSTHDISSRNKVARNGSSRNNSIRDMRSGNNSDPDISSGNSSARDIRCRNESTRNISCRNESTRDISCKKESTRNISSMNKCTRNINCRSSIAPEIRSKYDAWDISSVEDITSTKKLPNKNNIVNDGSVLHESVDLDDIIDYTESQNYDLGHFVKDSHFNLGNHAKKKEEDANEFDVNEEKQDEFENYDFKQFMLVNQANNISINSSRQFCNALINNDLETKLNHNTFIKNNDDKQNDDVIEIDKGNCNGLNDPTKSPNALKFKEDLANDTNFIVIDSD